MEIIVNLFRAIGLDFYEFAITAAILLVGTLLLSILGRFVFGKKSQLCSAISSAIGILFIYALTVVLKSAGMQFDGLLAPLPFVTMVNVVSAADMFQAVSTYAKDADMIFMAAAIADYTPASFSDNKIKKKDGDLSIPLNRTQDILKWLGENRRQDQVICGFSMETENLIDNSRAKLVKKNADMICANNLKVEGAGFGVDTNVISVITKDNITELPLQSKDSAANAILTIAKNLK
jgi:phosphopantothenoylcysteine synthetase/decarboxylase